MEEFGRGGSGPSAKSTHHPSHPRQSDMPAATPIIVPKRYGEGLVKNDLGYTGLAVVNDGEPAYDITILNVILEDGNRIEFQSGHTERLTKNDGEAFYPCFIAAKLGGTFGSGLSDFMHERGIGAVKVPITYRDSGHRWFQTDITITRDVEKPGGLRLAWHQKRIPNPKDPDAPISALENNSTGSTAGPTLLHWVLDHPKLAGLTAFIALALGFSPKTSTLGSWICLIIAAIFGVAMLSGIAEKKHWRKTSRVVVICSLLILVVIFGVWLTGAKEYLDGLYHSQPPQKSSMTQSSPPSSSIRSSPVIQAGTRMWAGFPISIAPHQTAHVLALRPTLKAEMENILNDKDVTWLWPSRQTVVPPEFVSIYQISNHDSVRVFNIQFTLPIRFNFSNREGGGLAADVTRTMWIESLEPGESYEFYAINQSKHQVDVPLPTVVELQVEGSTERITVEVVPHGILAETDISLAGKEQAVMPLMPSFHEWRGNQILKQLRPQ
jgi:energy-coupling factor transporter transmembrane protein EcfT